MKLVSTRHVFLESGKFDVPAGGSLDTEYKGLDFDESWKTGDEGDVGAYWGLWDKNEGLKF